jgi:hypothetical protein
MKHRDFRKLLDAGIVAEIVAFPSPSGKGWRLNVQTARPILDGFQGDLESDWRKLQPRRFANLDTLASYLRRLGVGLEGYIDEEEDDIRLDEGVAKVGEYTFAMQEDGVDEISERKGRSARLEGDLQALIDAASPGTANSLAIAQMRDLVDEITAVLQEE